MARQIMKSAWGFSGGVGGIVLTTFLNLALSGASGPTNPCTYAATADWGKCVYGQIAKYVEQHVTSYVAKEFQHYTNEVAKTRLAVWHLKLNDINNSVAIDTRKPGQNTTSNWLADFTDPVQELRFDMDGEWLRFLLTPVLPQFLNLHLTVESLALKAKQLRDAASIQKLARDSLCHAKMVLKRAANLTQRRVASFQGLMVHRKHHLEWVTHSSLLSHVIFFHRHTYDCPYYYPGQFDAECTSKEAVDKSNSTCTPKPPSFSPCLYCRDRGDGIPIPFLGDKAQCAPWETSSPGGAAATSWFCHRAKVLSTQQRVFEQWLQPIWNWINITRALQQAMENGEVPKWSPWSWKCYDEANLKSDQGLLGRMASCPFRILTTSSFEGKPSYVDRGTGAATDLGMWRPKRGSKGLYYLGDYCKDSHAADMHLTAMLLQHMPGHEDSLKSPVTMTFNWNDLHTHGDHDGGLFTPGCAEGYRPVGSVGEQDLPDSRAGPDNPPPPSRFNGLVCVKAEYTEEVHLTKDDWMWTDRRSHGHYDGAVFVGAVYMTASGVLVYGPCHAARGHPSHYTVYRVKESLVRWCTGMPAG
ncbi:pmpB [Symbiodinium necroappetens]|uniref:PmpB protein n=1 Tax=Symbiodinium necroappetens TaxID=1628268 RepID=A0A812NVC8_9DINO|nr:pmpB [Symbiodinium necroappetens]